MWILERRIDRYNWIALWPSAYRPDAIRDWQNLSRLCPMNEYRVRLDSRGFNDAILYS